MGVAQAAGVADAVEEFEDLDGALAAQACGIAKGVGLDFAVGGGGGVTLGRLAGVGLAGAPAEAVADVDLRGVVAVVTDVAGQEVAGQAFASACVQWSSAAVR